MHPFLVTVEQYHRSGLLITSVFLFQLDIASLGIPGVKLEATEVCINT